VRIGIDVGGTKIEAIGLASDGTIRARRRVDAPRGDYDRTVKTLVDLVEAIELDTGERGSVGLGIPGTISPATGLIKNANSTWLNGQPLDRDLSRALKRPVRLANDANCFALSEATDGAAAGAGVVFGVIIGTGCGGGVVVDGRVITGANAIAGEWGHNPLPAMRDAELPVDPCYCGRRGCIEQFLSGPGLSREHRQLGGDDATAAEVAARALAGDHRAATVLAAYEERLARSLGSIINVLDPQVIVLGGGLSNIERLYANVPRLWSPFVFSDRVDTRLVRAIHGDSSGVRGAAWLWEE
jgi:fructokinase